jgi:hypothetical protein
MNRIVKETKVRLGLLLILGVLAGVSAQAQAADPAYNVSGVTFSESGPTGEYYRITADLTVYWKPPNAADRVMNYYLRFNTSPNPLSDAEFSDATGDIEVNGKLDHTVPAIPKATFAAYDSPQVHYLHIKTQFHTTAVPQGFDFSEDVVIGPLLIDNVAPGGTMKLDPSAGSSRKVNVILSPLEPIRYYWLNESPTYSPLDAAKMDGSFLTPVWDLQTSATPPAQVPIYAWFQDMAGNRSATYAATATYNYLPTVAIIYNASSLNVGSTLGFTVDNNTPYDWTLNLSEAGVASIASGTTAITKTNAPSITVNGLKAGTFTVSAVPTGSTGTLTTGTITVVQTVRRGDVTGDGEITAQDAVDCFWLSFKTTWTANELAAADFNQDNDVTSQDAVDIFWESLK